ncbi:MAG: hypothetical protein QXW71_04380, partial [Thermoplasmata archaeon]
TSIYKLIKNYIYARIRFGKEKVKVYLTSSKRGFRIYINETVDVLTNLMERAKMDDDPYRILYSLKRYAMSGDEEEVDVEFYSKKYIKTDTRGEIEEIDLEKILTKELIEKLEEAYAKKEFEEILKEKMEDILNKFKDIVKMQEVLYCVVDKKSIDYFANELIEKNIKFRVFADVYNDNNVIFRIIGKKEILNEILNTYKDIIKKYKFITEESKI